MGAWNFIIENIKMIRIRDIIDILIVAFVVYKGIKLISQTRAAQLLKGIVILIVAMQFSNWFQFNSISYLLANTMEVGVLALLIVFQPELRSALEKVGRSSVSRLFINLESDVQNIISEIAEAAKDMANTKTGALIVIERNTRLADIAQSGIAINASITKQLLCNIFIPNTPLHDGAVLISDGKIKAAACFLPLTSSGDLSKELGTRHRAAVGVSEVSDCAVIVVSEETGKISLALEGGLTRNLTVETLKKALTKILSNDLESRPTPKSKLFNWTVKKR